MDHLSSGKNKHSDVSLVLGITSRAAFTVESRLGEGFINRIIALITPPWTV